MLVGRVGDWPGLVMQLAIRLNDFTDTENAWLCYNFASVNLGFALPGPLHRFCLYRERECFVPLATYQRTLGISDLRNACHVSLSVPLCIIEVVKRSYIE
jgi:hypothetical protein